MLRGEKKTRAVLLLLGLLISSCTTLERPAPTSSLREIFKRTRESWVLVSAGPDPSGAVPRFSAEALDRACALGAEMIRLPVRPSRDGRFFVVGDSDLGDLTGVKARIEDLTASEVQVLRIAHPRRPSYSAYHLLPLEEALRHLRSRAFALVDPLGGSAEEVARAVFRVGPEVVDRTVLLAHTPGEAAAMRDVDPKLLIAGSLLGRNNVPDALRRYAWDGVILIEIEHAGIESRGEILRGIRDLGMWAMARMPPGVAKDDEARRRVLDGLVREGVRVIETDEPARFQR